MGTQVLSFRCILKNRFGIVLSSTVNRDVITQGPSGDKKLRKLAAQLEGIRKGETRKIPLSAAEAYGTYDPKLVITRPREDVPANETLKVGDPVVLKATTEPPKLFRVIEILNDTVYLDGNHPYAGQDLIFEIEAFEAREATPEEIAEIGDGFDDEASHAELERPKAASWH